ncbi:alpha/beta hydrolase family protein [Polyangium mundeleinium]|uniref:Peptidase S9 prolyl oligopeptidase catalytic domain-containing protein n=1 Tax=Polyangium mundeleinium TaxID=2995306 RepID=A0ABT5ERX6_9BACT|nr:hypothetical protein [Polyangium mundeleinium]MDC0743486.1 hypothetical protein [Polyangium mundeleinium]
MLRSLLSTAASRFDTAVGGALLLRRGRPKSPQPDPEALGHAARMEALALLRSIYDLPEHYELGFFPTPAPLTPSITRVRPMGGPEPGTVLDLTWPSRFDPIAADVRERYLSHEANATAAARLFLHAGPARPAAILIHGYRCGQYRLEERIWPVQWLYDRGLDVALFVLPFHAVRSHESSPRFPGSDPRVTNEGFRQTVLDLRALLSFLRDRGSEAVGVMGMSLGGYSTSLLSTVDDRVAFAVPIIPLASLADVARAAGRFVGSPEEQRRQYEELDAVHRVVSPFARPSRIPSDQVLVLAASEDKITPVDHARRLADHFNAPLETFHGGHLLQFGRADAFRAVGRMLGRLGLFSRR